MATEAGTTEVLLPTKGEVEAVSLTPLQFEKPISESFTVELKKCEESELKCLETETLKSATPEENVKGVYSNSGTLEDASFLASASGPAVSKEEASRPEDCQVGKLKPLETVITENAKHLEKVEQLGVVDEIVYEVDANGKDHHVQSTTDEVVKGGELKSEVKADKAVAEVIMNHQESIDEGTRSTEEDTRDSGKGERGGQTEDNQAEVASKETPCEETTLDHKTEALVHNVDLLVEKDVQSVEETSPKDENIVNTTEASLSIEECAEQRSTEETKQEDKCIEVVSEGKVFEANFSSENTEKEKEKDQITDGGVEETSNSTISSSRESQSNGTGVAAKDEPEWAPVTDEVGEQPLGVCKDKSEDTNGSTNEEKDESSTKDELHETISSVTLPVAEAEEVCSQEVENLEILKVHPEIGSGNIAKESPIEVAEKTEIFEETTQARGTLGGDSNDAETFVQELDTKVKEDVCGKSKSLDITEAVVEAQGTEGSSLVVAEEHSSVQAIQELTEMQSTKHEEQPKELLPHDEPEGELQTHAVISKEAKRGEEEIVTSVKEDGAVKNLEESFEQKEREDETIAISDTKENEVPSEEIVTLPSIHSDEKAESIDAELIKVEAHDLLAANFLDEQAEVQGRKTDKALEMYKDEKSDETVSDIPKEDKAEEKSNEQESTEDDVKKEEIIEGDITCSVSEPIQGESIKSLEENVKDAEKLNDKDETMEIIKDGNVKDLSPESIQEDASATLEGHVHEAEKTNKEVLEELEIAGVSESNACETNKDIESIVDESLVKKEEGEPLDPVESSAEEKKLESLKEEALDSRYEDEACVLESTEGNVNKEQIVEREITFSASESVQEETSKCSPGNNKDAEELDEGERTTKVVKEANDNDLSPENIRDATGTLEDYNGEAKTSKDEVIKELETAAAGESIPCETNEEAERSINASSMMQDECHQEEGKDVGSTEASAEDNKVEIPKKVASESRGENGSHEQTTRADFVKEQIIEEVTVSTPELAHEETSKSSQDDMQGAENISEERKEHITNDGNANDLSPAASESIPCEKNEEAERSTDASSMMQHQCETNKDVEGSVDASVKQEESQKEEGKHEDPKEVSIEENTVETPKEEPVTLRDEDEGSIQEDVTKKIEDQENEVESCKENEVESCKEKVVEELETVGQSDSIQCETNKDAEASADASVKQEESQKEEGKHEDPKEVLIEENTVETPKEEPVTLRDEDEGSIQEDVTKKIEDQENEVENCKEKVVEELETVGQSDSIHCETNKDAEASADASVKQGESQKEEGKHEDPKEVSIENTVEIPKEEPVISRGEDESNEQSAAANSKKEHIIEEAIFPTTDSNHEETKSSQDSVKDDEKIIEESAAESIQEGCVTDFPQEIIQEYAIEKSEGEAEKCKEEVIQELETPREVEIISHETKNDAESSTAASVVNLEESQQEGVEYQDQVKASEEDKKVEDTSSTEIVKDDDNKFKATEKGTELAAEGEEKQLVDDKRDEQLEILVHATPEQTETEPSENSGKVTCIDVQETTENFRENSETVQANFDDKNDLEKEIPKESETAEVNESIPCNKNEDVERSAVASSVKHQAEHIVTCIDVYETAENLETSETIKTKDADVTNDSPKEIPEESEAAEPSQSIPCRTNEDVVESVVDTSSLKQEDEQNESKGQDLEAVPEDDNKVEEKKYAVTVKEDGENAVKATEEGVEVAYKDEEDQQQAMKEDEPGKQLENLLNVTPKETETESSIQTNITCREVEGTKQNLEEISVAEKEEEKIEKIENANDSEKVVVEDLETAKASESILCETSKDVESSVDPSLAKQDGSTYLDQTETLIEEKKVNEILSTKVVDDYDDIKVEATEKTIDVSAIGTDDEKQAMQKDEPGDMLHVKPEETHTESSSGHVVNNTCIEVERNNQNLEETSEPEKKEEKENNVDNANESEKEAIEMISASQETKEQVSREIEFVEEFQKYDKTETNEDTKESQVINVLEEQGITEPSSLSIQEEKVEESSKEFDKELNLEQEGKQFESKEQKVPDLVKDESESLDDSAKPNEDVCTTITSEALEDVKVAEEMQEKETSLKETISDGSDKIKGYDVALDKTDDVYVQESDSTSTENSTGEIGLKEAEPDSGEPVKSYDIAPEDKDPGSSIDVEVQSLSITSDIVSEATSLKEVKLDSEEKIRSCEIESKDKEAKEVKPDEEERIRISDFYPEPKDVSRIIDVGLQSDSVSTTVAIEETKLKEAEPENEDGIRNCDIAPEALESSDVEVKPDSEEKIKSCETESKETDEKEVKPDEEERIRISDFYPEPKDVSRSINVGLQSDFVSTTMASEETSLKEVEPENEVQARSCDVAPEDKALTSSVVVDTQPDSHLPRLASDETNLEGAELREGEEQVRSSEIQSDHVPTETVSAETCVNEAEAGDTQVKVLDVASVEKSLKSSVDINVEYDSISTENVNEEKEEVKAADDEQVTCDFVPEKKGLPSDKEVGVQSDSVSAEILRKETSMEEEKQDNEEQVNSSNITLEEKVLESSIDTGSVSEERSLKEVGPDNEEQAIDVSPEKKSLGSSVDELQSNSISAEIEREETCLKDDKPKNGGQVESPDITPQEASPRRGIDIDVQPDAASTGVTSEETNLKEDQPDCKEQVNYSNNASEEKASAGIASEETDSKEAEPDSTEQVKYSDNAYEEKVLENIDEGEVEQKDTKLEEDVENKIHLITGEFEEKTAEEISENATKEREISTETPLVNSPEEDQKESPTVPSMEHRPVTVQENERSDETAALHESQCENEKLITPEAEKEEGFLQQEDDSKLESCDTEKGIFNVETQEQRDTELNMPPEIISKDVTPTEVRDNIEKDDDNGNARQQVTDRESISSEFHPVSTEDERVYEEKDSSTVGADSQAKENIIEKHEQVVTEMPKEEKLSDGEVSKVVDVYGALQAEEKIKEESEGNDGNKSDGIDNTNVGGKTAVPDSAEAQLVDEPVKAFDEPECVKLEERSFDLVSEQLIDQNVPEVTAEKCTISEVEGLKLAPNTGDPDAAASVFAFEKHEAETTVKTEEDVSKEVESRQDKEEVEPKLHKAAEERLQTCETKDDIKISPEAAAISNYESTQDDGKDEIVVDRDISVGVVMESVEAPPSTLLPEESEHETTCTVRQMKDDKEELEVLDTEKLEESLATEVVGEQNLKKETEADIIEVPVEVSNNNARSIEVAAEEEIVEKRSAQMLPSEEQNDGTMTTIKVDEENGIERVVPDNEMRDHAPIKVENREIKASAEAEEEIKDASTTISESCSQSTGIITEEKTIPCETITEKSSEVQQLVEQSDLFLPKERDGETTPRKEIKEMEESKEVETQGYENTENSLQKIEKEMCLTEEEPRELKELISSLEVLSADKVEGITEASETAPKEVISRDLPSYQAVAAEKDEIVTETVSSTEKIEKEDTKEVKLTENEVCLDKEKPKKLEVSELGIHASVLVQEGLKETPKVDCREGEEYARNVDSEQQNDKATETRETVVEAPSLNIDKYELASDVGAERVESPEPLTSIEDVEIIENHVRVAATDVGKEEIPREMTIEAGKQEIQHKEELSTETTQEKCSLNTEKAHEISGEIKQSEESFNAKYKEKSLPEAETKVTNRDVEIPVKLVQATEEASPKDCIDRETKEEKEGQPALISLSELMQDSKEEIKPTAENLKEETEEEKRSKEADNEKARTDEEKDDDEEHEEHEEEEEHDESEHPDAPILVQSSKDIDGKASRKKSHGLFSGVGSKVKHSISKVKKAITGKSTPSKTQPSTTS